MANERLALTIDVQTAGEANLNRLSDAMNKVVSISEQAGKSGAAFSGFPQAIEQFVQSPVQAAQSSLVKFASGFGVVGIAAGAAVTAFGLFSAASISATNDLAELGDKTDDLALQLGLTTKEVGAFDFAARSTGDTIDVFSSGIKKLSEGLANGGEEGKKAADALETLGVKTRSLDGSIRPMGALFQDIAAGINKVGDTATRNTLMIDLFGKAGISLLPTLSTLKDRTAYFEAHGFGFDEAKIAEFTKLKTKIVEAQEAWDMAALHFKEGIAGTFWISVKGAGAAILESLATSGRGSNAGENTFAYGGHAAAGMGRATGPAGVFSIPGLGGGTSGILGDNGSIARDKSAFGGTLAGAQAELEGLKSKALAARSDYFGAAGQVSGEAASRLKTAWSEAESALKRAEDRVKLLSKAEGERMAVMEQAAKLTKEGTPYYILGNNQAITQPYQNPRKVPSLLRGNEMPGDVGMGTFVSPIEDRRAAAGVGTMADGAWSGFMQQVDRENQIKRDGLKNELDYRTRIVELTAGPGGELSAALKVNQLRLDTVYKEFEITNDLVKLEDERTRIAYDGAVRVEEYKARKLQEAKNFGSGLFGAATGGGLGGFLKGQVLGLGSTVAGNASGELFKLFGSMIPHASGGGIMSKLLGGTAFGADPLKGATDANTLATIANTAALQAMGGASGGGIGGALGSLSGIFGGAPDVAVSGIPGGASATGLTAIPGLGPLPGAKSGMSLGSKIGIAGAAVGGGLTAYDQFRHGDARGAVGGVGALAGMAGSIMMMAGMSGPAAPIMLGVGAALGLVTSLMGDPKKIRQNEIQRELERSLYHAPTAINATMDGSGNYSDFDYRGNSRRSNLRGIPQTSNPYTTWRNGSAYEVPGGETSPYTVNHITINAMDAGSFHAYLKRNADSVADAVADHLGTSEGRLSGAVRFLAAA